MEAQCIICESSKPQLMVSSRVVSFRDASYQRGDGFSERLDDDAQSFTCHTNCVSTYCSKEHIKRYLRKRKSEEKSAGPSTSPKRLRKTIEFSFFKHCLFCGDECNVERSEKNPSRWRKSYLCRTADRKGKISWKAQILECAKKRGDKWGNDVAFRTNCALSDLHAAEARYHKDCMSKFFSNQPVTSADGLIDTALDELINQMHSDRTRIWNSVELHELYQELGGMQLSRRLLINYLGETLHPDLLVLSSPGVASILVFKSNAATQLRIVDDVEDECNERAISSLAKKIKAESLLHKPDPDTYPARLPMDYVSGECSGTLLALLAQVDPRLDSTLPATMIGHIVLGAVCGQATSLQIGLSVLLNQQRSIIDQLHNYGITSTYNELRRFRISAAASMAKDRRGLAEFDNRNGLIQVVADNFDTQISSPNGQKSTHGLAMVITQAGKPKPTPSHDVTDVPKIKRLKWEETKATNLSLGEVSVQRSHGNKKAEMPEQYGQRVVPKLALLASMQVSKNIATAQDIGFLKEVVGENQCPEYSGFNTKHARDSGQQPKQKTGVVYTPFLDMTPAEPDTMKTAMVQAQYLTSLTGQEWTVLTCDQQLYQVAVNITWVDQDTFAKFVPRLGGMHMLMSFIGSVGSLMGGSGLEDILQSTFAGVPKLLSGKKYPQNVRALRIVVEELLQPILTNEEIQTIAELNEYLDAACQKSRTIKLWVNCLIKPILISMAFVRAEREGDWPLHLLAVEKMLPYFFASGHVNYARYGLYYLRSMQRLHPTVLKRFMDGEHVMRHQDGLWNGIWSDLFIETTYMRHGKGPSGIIGSTLNESTLAIWALSLSIFGQLKNDMEAMQDGEVQKVVTCHKEERHTSIKADAADRLKIREALSTCIDIFDDEKHPPSSLVNIFTGQIVDDRTVNVDDAVKIGTDQWLEYEKTWPKGFHDTLKRKVKGMSKASKLKATADAPRVVNTEMIYARVIGILASSREAISTKTLFSYELAPYPPALFDENGEARTTSKSVLKTKIKVEYSQRKRAVPEVIILDGCAILWTVPWPASPAKVSTFVDAAVATIMHYASISQVLHVVFDRYYETSIKSCCRTTRAKGFSRVYKLNSGSPLPKQALTLNVTANKEQIIKLIVDQLCSMQVPEGKQVIITGLEPNPIEVGVGAQQVAVTHEEADVTMAYHMITEAVNGHSPIKVVSDDTDVLVILAHHLHLHTNNIPQTVQVVMESCSRNRTVIDVNEVINKHEKIMPNLLAAHALTGCDTVSCFAGIGKTSVLKKLEAFTDTLLLGDPSASMDEVIVSCLKYVSTLYGQVFQGSLDTMRRDIFTRKIGGKRHLPPKLSSLPPTMAAFRPHCERAHYQTILWMAAGMPAPPTLDPLKNGWMKKCSTLQPVYLLDEQSIAPDEVLNLISCGCKSDCKSALCSCTKSALACTDFCKCRGDVGCENPMKAMSQEGSDDSDDSSFDE